MDLTRPDRARRLALLAAEYALGTLPPRVRRRIEAASRRSPVVADALRDWELRLALLGHAVPAVNPSPAVWDRIADRLELRAHVHDSRSWRSKLRLWRGLAIASTIAAFTVGVAHFTAHLDPSRTTLIAVLTAPDAPSTWIVTAPVGGGTLIIKAVPPVDVAPDRSLELWALPTDAAPRSLGLLPTTGSGRLLLPLYSLETVPALAVSLEPRGGSPTGAPTGPVLYSGKIERI
ncbi:MAG TPA: anti-sigma factor [Casimicrobiaceae bacterium]|nr:anti-sigma factor [Casimicrobiaceae bacterium]